MNYLPEWTTVRFIEVPDEISLVIPITGCGRHCENCHTPELQDGSNGVPFTLDILKLFIAMYKDISCVCFFEGDKHPDIIPMLKYIKKKHLKTALYTGADEVDSFVPEWFDYVKIGHYDPKLGGLDSKTTNQKMYYHNDDITYKFRKDEQQSD